MEKDHKIVLVIGNGFDLDLGLKTRYSDFMESSFFKEHVTGIEGFDKIELLTKRGEEINLFNYLNDLSAIEGWIDFEEALANLASRKYAFNMQDGSQVKASKLEESTFWELHEALFKYLCSITDNPLVHINPHSKAFRLLKIINESRFSEILSYNYTDLTELAEHENIKIDTPIDYIHGSLSKRSIIMGIQDDLSIDNSYCFMIKSFSSHFHSHNVREKLLDADEIIFFGHSLGSSDYHYFEDLFRTQSLAEEANENLILRIFTYDEKSRRDILIQLRAMNNKRTDMLYDLCDFEIYRTGDGDDEDKIDSYFDKLKERIIYNKSFVGLPVTSAFNR